jgi:hypothetical protein
MPRSGGTEMKYRSPIYNCGLGHNIIYRGECQGKNCYNTGELQKYKGKYLCMVCIFERNVSIISKIIMSGESCIIVEGS